MEYTLMNRRSALKLSISSLCLAYLGRPALAHASQNKLGLSRAEWLKILTPAQYDVLFREATERPFSSELNGREAPGTYVCAACNNSLFKSEHKYDSGTGWPSFFQAIDGALGTSTDYKLLIPRTEYHCAHCGGHQGHVFKDGPKPTGLRYCNNGLALAFVPEGESVPALRTKRG